MNFSDFLEKEQKGVLKTNNSLHISNPPVNDVEQVIHIKNTDDVDVDNGEINIEKEMAELAKTTLNFKFASKSARGYYRKLQNVIKGGGMI
jgi:flagellar basal body rod protein FlgB